MAALAAPPISPRAAQHLEAAHAMHAPHTPRKASPAPVVSMPAANHAVAVPPNAPLYSPGAVGGLINGTFSSLSNIGMLMMGANMLSNVTGWLAERKVLGIGNVFKPIDAVVRSPETLTKNNNVGDVVNTASGALKGVADIAEGRGWKGTAEKLSSAGQTVRNAENAVSGKVLQFSNVAATHVGNAADRVARNNFVSRATNWLAGRNQVHADTYAKAANEALSEARKHMGSVDSTVRSAADSYMTALRGADKSVIEKASTAFNKVVSEAATKLKESKNSKSLEALGNVSSGINSYATAITGSNMFKNKVEAWKKPGEYLKNAPQRIANMNMQEAIQKGTNIAYNAMMVYHSASIMRSGMAALKQMHLDLTGEKVGTFKLLFGSLPPMMKEARKQYLKSAIPMALGNILGMVAGDIVSRRAGPSAGMFKSIAMNIMPQMAVNKVAEFIAGTNPMVNTYTTIYNTQAAGERAGVNDYAQLIACASANAKSAGGMDNQYVMQIAQYFTQNQASAGDVLRACSDGTIDRMRAELGAAKPAAQAQTGPAVQQPQQKQALGQFTQQYLDQQNAMMRGAVPHRP